MSDAPAPRSVAAFHRQVQLFLDSAEIPPWIADDDARFASLRDWHRRLFDAGLLGVTWPVQYGGQGLTAMHQLALTTEFALRGAPPPIGETGLKVVGPSIIVFGTDDQRATLLSRILSGEDLWCLGFSEPEAGSDLSSLRTTADEHDGVLVINGQKNWSSYAKWSNRCALLVRTDPHAARPHKGISYLLVDLGLPGIEVRPITQITGSKEFADIWLTDVEVPVQALLGPRNEGWKCAMHTLAHDRGPYVLKRSIELQAIFSRVLAALAGCERDTDVAAEVGRARVLLDMLDAQGVATTQRLGAGEGPAAEDSLDKLALTFVDQAVTGALSGFTEGFQTVRGASPRGLDVDELTESYFFGRAASIYGGTAQIQRNTVAERMLGLPKG